jgi:hypothetical protein
MAKSRASAAETIFDERVRPVGPDSVYARRFTDLKIASQQVGASSLSRLAWVVRFVGEKPETWHSATPAAHGDCLHALAGHAIPPNMVGGISLPAPMDAADVDAIHREVKAFLVAAVGHAVLEPVPIRSDGLQVGLVRLSEIRARPAVWSLVYSAAAPAVAVLHAVKDLVLQAGDRLVACRYCGEPVLAVKKRAFCNEHCAQRFRNEKRPARLVAASRQQKGRGSHGKTTRTRGR